ncbi:GNAT family N-acetyltransferase [Cohnella sp. GCM10020058]|uniref:GNAT family N-acetyltransferase n=1 Tax=Cohnella sp. GCM10020058 TaxID=3317330 RepID=UPI00363FF477
MTQQRQLPQLVMRRSNLADLPPFRLPEGYACRSFEPGDEAHWERIVKLAFGWERSFREYIQSHFYYRPGRVLFLCREGIPVATACAWQEPEWGEDWGYLHMVGVDPAFAGQGLGYAVSLAALHRMQEDGKACAVLETDDFRLPAVRTYLKLDFRPDVPDEALRNRWKLVYRELGLPYGVKVASATRPGSAAAANEDALVVYPESHVYGVVDGVSAMLPYKDEAGFTGGRIAAGLLAEALGAGAGDADFDLADAVLRANASLMDRMLAAGVDVASKWKRWGAVFAVVRWRCTHLEYVQAGDCMLLARYRDGSVRTLTRNQVAAFDLKALQAKQQLLKNGTLPAEKVSQRLKPVFKCNRDKANAPDGYAVMNGDPALAYTMEYGRISCANVVRLYAVTDGMFHFIENDDDPRKWEKLADALDERGIELYMDQLEREEALDPDCERHPRHKKSDDKSAVILELPSETESGLTGS